MKKVKAFDIFGNRIIVDSDCCGVASAMLQVYLRTHLGIDSNDSFNLLCVDDLEMIDTYKHVTGKDIKQTIKKYKRVIIDYEFPTITGKNIYK